jgi:pimeloyl-ACP methyl ester carboxylesterase
MSRGYWDLRPPDDDTYSMARWMAGKGLTVISVDHLGTGESVLPHGMTTPLLGQVITANDAAFRLLCDELRDAIPNLLRIGVGHSMGAALTVRQQATHQTYDAVALLGFGTKGLPAFLSKDVLAASASGPPDDERLAELTVRMFGSAYPTRSGNHVDGEKINDPAQRALKAAETPLLGAGGLLSMLPDNVAAEAARLRVPVLVLNAEYDSLLVGQPAEADRYREATSFASHVLPGAGHNHNVASTRRLFWEELRRWAVSVVPPRST